jgi:hypothetical protein
MGFTTNLKGECNSDLEKPWPGSGARPIRPPRPQPGRSFVPGGGGDTSSEVASLKDRYMRSSQKVLQRMGSNLAFMGKTAKQTVAEAGKFVRSWSSDD